MTAKRTRGSVRQAGASLVLKDGATGQTTLTSASTAARVLTLPDVTDILVGLAATQTLTNKTLSGNTATTLVSGAGTLTLNTSGTFTLPNVTDTAAGLAATQTLTNKTISGASNTLTVRAASDVTGTLPVANGGTGVTSSTGSGSNVLSTSPTLTTPVLGAATATSINKMAITAPATSSTLAVADGKTLTASNTLTLTATDGSTAAFGAGGTVAYTGNKLSVFASTTSAELAGVVSDETGSGALVFATSPTLVTPALGTPSAAVLTNATGLPLTTGVTGTLPIGNGGTGQTTAAAAYSALSPLTTKGDIQTYSSTTARLGVGADGTVLTADSAQTTGLKWSAPLTNPMAAAGDMIYGGSSGAATKLATGVTTGLLHGGNGATPTWSLLVNADVSASAAIAYSKLSLSGSIVNADISSSAAIAGSKLQAATSSNTGTINWYEEGTITATLAGSTTAGTPTYSAQVGSFTRIGRRVHFTIYIATTNWTGSPAGTVTIGGLPYTAKNTSNLFSSCAVTLDNWGLPASSLYVTGLVIPNTTTIQLYANKTGATAAAVDAATNNGAANRDMTISGSYDV